MKDNESVNSKETSLQSPNLLYFFLQKYLYIKDKALIADIKYGGYRFVHYAKPFTLDGSGSHSKFYPEDQQYKLTFEWFTRKGPAPNYIETLLSTGLYGT